MLLPLDDYKKIIKSMPILCIDVIIINPQKKYLLVKRKNEPLKSEYWIPGGRIFHYENINNGIDRILHNEVNIIANDLKKFFIGVYQDFFNENSFESNTKYHTISIVFQINIDNKFQIKLDNQSENYIWSDKLPNRFVNNIIK